MEVRVLSWAPYISLFKNLPMLTNRETPLDALLDIESSVVGVKEFIRSRYHNLWVEDQLLTVYLRKAQRCQPITGETRRCLDVANIQVTHVGKGTWSAWIAAVETLAREEGLEALWVENVLTGKFATWFRQRPEWIESSGVSASFMLLLEKR